MESSEAFGQGGIEIGEGEDPFAGTDFGDFGEPANGTATAELKTVDKEGHEVTHAPADAASVESQTGEAAQPPATPAAEPAIATEPQAVAENTQPRAGDQRTDAEREEDARRYREERGEGEYAPPKALEHQERLRAIAEREASEKQAAEKAAAEPDPVGPTHHMAGAERPAGDPTPPVESAGQTEDPTPASSPPAPAVSVEPESDGSDEEDADAPEEPKDSSGKTTKRRYVVLKVVAPGKFEQITWYEEKGKPGEIVPKGPGTKRQGIVLARGAEDALKFGYVAAGAPPDGINLVAVAQLHFQPKPVKPAPPKPSSVRLQIG